MMDESTSEKEGGRKFRGRRKTQLVVSVLPVCRRRETRMASTRGMHHERCAAR